MVLNFIRLNGLQFNPGLFWIKNTSPLFKTNNKRITNRINGDKTNMIIIAIKMSNKGFRNVL